MTENIRCYSQQPWYWQTEFAQYRKWYNLHIFFAFSKQNLALSGLWTVCFLCESCPSLSLGWLACAVKSCIQVLACERSMVRWSDRFWIPTWNALSLWGTRVYPVNISRGGSTTRARSTPGRRRKMKLKLNKLLKEKRSAFATIAKSPVQNGVFAFGGKGRTRLFIVKVCEQKTRREAHFSLLPSSSSFLQRKLLKWKI